METTKAKGYKEIARNNTEKTKDASRIEVGDFLYLVGRYGKELGLVDFIRTDFRMPTHLTLVKVMAIVEVGDDYEMLDGWMSKSVPEHPGGSCSDDVPDDRKPWEWTPEEIATFYQMVTIFRNRKGQFIAVDCQGYDYWRHVYLSPDWKEMFAEEIPVIRAAWEAEEAAREEAERKECEENARKYAARCEEVARRYPKMKKNPKGAAGITANVKHWFKVEFPQYPVTVSTKPDYYGEEYSVRVVMPKNLSEDEQRDVYEKVYMWKESMPTGEMRGYETLYDKPMRAYGNIMYGGLSICFYGE